MAAKHLIYFLTRDKFRWKKSKHQFNFQFFIVTEEKRKIHREKIVRCTQLRAFFGLKRLKVGQELIALHAKENSQIHEMAAKVKSSAKGAAYDRNNFG